MSAELPADLPPIPAAKNAFADAIIYRLLIRWPLWNSFERVAMAVRGTLPTAADGPLIVYLNHPSWWDGHMCFLLLKMVLRQQHEGYLMMEEKQLRAYRFFTWCGAFSVNRHDADSATRSVNYIARLLRRPKPTLLFIFPQGKIAPNDRRPITAYPGAARVAQQVGRVTLLPVGLRYEFRGEQRPEAWMLVGPAHVVDAPDDLRALSDDMARRLTENADDLQQMALSGQTDELKTLIPGRPGVNRVFDMVFGSLMRRMKR